MNMFTLEPEQLAKIHEWSHAQDQIVIATQREKMSPEEFDHLTMNGDYAYYGAIGGELTYCFTPNGLGCVVVVRHSGTNAELDVSEYDSW